MSAKNGFETNLLLLLFNNDAIANIGDSSGLQPSGADGNLYLALYTVAPTDSTAGTECAYDGYARVAVARATGAGGWTVSGDNASNVSAITWPQCVSSSSEVALAFAICTGDTVDVDDQLIYGALSPTIAIDTGVTPEIGAGDLDINCD